MVNESVSEKQTGFDMEDNKPELKEKYYCEWCGKPTHMDKTQVAETPILEHLEERINKADRKKIWGQYSDWSKAKLSPSFEAELLVYDEMLNTIDFRRICATCLEEDEHLYTKYYGDEDKEIIISN